MATWAPNTSAVIDNGFGGSRGGEPITGAWTHHTTSTNARDYVAGWNDRESHPTYHISNTGIVTGIVHPDRKPSSTLDDDGYSCDSNAITAEIDNVVIGGNWDISEESKKAWAIIVKHHADESPRAGNPVELNENDRIQAGFWLGYHAQVMATACCGPDLISNMGHVINMANGAPSTPSAPYDELWNDTYSTRAIQEIVKVTVDGEYGPDTTSAVSAWQTEYNKTHVIKLDVDGDVGPLTWAAMHETTAGPVTPPPVVSVPPTTPAVPTDPVTGKPLTKFEIEKLYGAVVIIAGQASVWLPTNIRKKVYQFVSTAGAILTSLGIIGVAAGPVIGGEIGAQVIAYSGIVTIVAGALGAGAAKLADKNTKA